MIDKAKRQMDLLAEDDPEYFDKKEFLESVIISLEGSIAYANRLAELAEEKQREAGVTEETAKPNWSVQRQLFEKCRHRLRTPSLRLCRWFC